MTGNATGFNFGIWMFVTAFAIAISALAAGRRNLLKAFSIFVSSLFGLVCAASYVSLAWQASTYIATPNYMLDGAAVITAIAISSGVFASSLLVVMLTTHLYAIAARVRELTPKVMAKQADSEPTVGEITRPRDTHDGTAERPARTDDDAGADAPHGAAAAGS